jgi:cyclopropane-fatty-acyl-phospholipid synthase
MHYAYTLDRWVEAFERQAERIRGMFDERFVRMWRMYLHSSAATFRWGYLNLWQISFTKGLVNDLPLTRDYIHAGEGSVKTRLASAHPVTSPAR